MKGEAYVRTTVDIPRPLYNELRKRAAKDGSSIKQLVVQGVERVLGPEKPQRKRRIDSAIVKSKRPGSLKITNKQIYELGFP